MTGVSNVHPRFLNDLLNSSYVAELSDPDSGLEAPNLGAMIVATHAMPTTNAIIDGAVDAVLHDSRDTAEMLRLIGAMPSKLADAEPISAPRTYEEIELEMLKIGVLDPDLYNNLRLVFTEHKHPEKLDAVGQQLREFFIKQKG
jgi:hypothetical protein